jgi:hypothetical protein
VVQAAAAPNPTQSTFNDSDIMANTLYGSARRHPAVADWTIHERPGGHPSGAPSTLQFYFPGHSAGITLLLGFHYGPKPAPTEATMLKDILRFAMLSVLFSCGSLLAQNGAPSPAGNPPQTRQEPCWRQAGISRTVMEEHRSIETDAHSQVASVCENSSLTPQQKQQQVREIRQQALQKLDALITPEQQSALHSCQQQRAANGSPNGGHHQGGAGPCGNFAVAQGRQGSSNGRVAGSNPEPPAADPQN